MQDRKIRALQRNIVLKAHTGGLISKVLTNGTMLLNALNLIPQGETDVTRESSSIILKSLSLRWTGVPSAVSTINVGLIRFIIGVDHDPQGALPLAGDILTAENALSS